MAKDLFLSTQWIILGVLLDELMSWNGQSYQVKLKINRTTGILSKFRGHVIRTAYYSLFQSHLQYGVQLQG